MQSYADRLRELADLLDKDYRGNAGAVAIELLEIARLIVSEVFGRPTDA